jgi:hypothetical protein
MFLSNDKRRELNMGVHSRVTSGASDGFRLSEISLPVGVRRSNRECRSHYAGERLGQTRRTVKAIFAEQVNPRWRPWSVSQSSVKSGAAKKTTPKLMQMF